MNQKRRPNNKSVRPHKKVLKTNVGQSSSSKSGSQNNNTNKGTNQIKNTGSGVKFISTNVVREKEQRRSKNRNDNRQNNNYSGQNRNNSRNKRRDYIKKDNSQKNNKKNYRSVKRTIIPYTVNSLTEEKCVLCEKQINNMSSAIKLENEKFYHFDCLIKDIKEKHQVKPMQRVVYLGSQTFGIIEDVKENGRKTFKISEKIDFKEHAAS